MQRDEELAPPESVTVTHCDHRASRSCAGVGGRETVMGAPRRPADGQTPQQGASSVLWDPGPGQGSVRAQRVVWALPGLSALVQLPSGTPTAYARRVTHQDCVSQADAPLAADLHGAALSVQ